MSAISKEMNYSLKPSAVKCSRITRQLVAVGNNATDGFATGQDTIIIYIPAGTPRTFWDGKSATLKYTLGVNATAAADIAAAAHTVYFDYGGWSPIRRIDVYGSGGQLIESIDHYNLLQNMLHDTFYSPQDLNGLSSMLGTNEGRTADATTLLASQTRRGAFTFTNLSALANGATGTVQYGTVSIPLNLALFNLSDKYTPCGMMSDDVRLEIVLETTIASAVIPALANWTNNSVRIINPTIYLDYITVEDDQAMAQIVSSYGGEQIVLQSTTFHNYETTIPSGTSTNYTAILPCKAMSARYYLGVFRQLTISNVQAGYTNSAFSNPFRTSTSNFSLSLGGVLVPQSPITALCTGDVSQFFAYLQQAYHAMGALVCNGQLTRTGYQSTDALLVVTDLPAVRAFQVGIPLDTLRQNTDVMLSGVNLSGITSYTNMNFGLATTGLYTFDSFVCHDILFVINPDGTMVSKW